MQERLIDYYFTVTASKRSIEGTKKRLQKQGSLAQKGVSRSYHASFAYKPKIVDRYPRQNHHDTPLLPWVARACLPRGVRVRTKPPPPKFSTFIGWNKQGQKLYGACLLVFEKLHLSNQNQPVFLPKALGFISHYPLFYAFEVFLRCLWHSIPRRIIPLETLLIHYFYDIPAPPIGKKIAYDLGRMKVLLAQRSMYDLPVLELPVSILFQRLSVERIVVVLKLLLLESRIILVSSQESELSLVAESELTAVAETLSSFIYPLKWNHLYIPLMSKKVGAKLSEYQGPFLVGIPAYLLKRDEFTRLPKRAVIVDLEKNEIRTAHTDNVITDKSPAWPPHKQLKIQKALEQAARVFVDENRTRHQTYHCLKKIFAFMTSILRDAQAGRNRVSPSNPVDNSQFCKRLRETELFKDFCHWYHETRDNQDPKLQQVFQFFMDHEELGVEFAKPVKTSLNGIAFDVKDYDMQWNQIDDTLIKQAEKTKRKATTTMKYEQARKKQKAAAPAEITTQALKFVTKHMLTPTDEDSKGSKGGKRHTSRGQMSYNRYSNSGRGNNRRTKSRKEGGSSQANSHNPSRPRAADRVAGPPPRRSPPSRKSDPRRSRGTQRNRREGSLEMLSHDANLVSQWLKQVSNRPKQPSSSPPNTSLLAKRLDQVEEKYRKGHGSSSGSLHSFAVLLAEASRTVKACQKGEVSVDAALKTVTEKLGRLSTQHSREDTDHSDPAGMLEDQMENLTPDMMRRLLEQSDLPEDGFSDASELKDDSDSSVEDWDVDSDHEQTKKYRDDDDAEQQMLGFDVPTDYGIRNRTKRLSDASYGHMPELQDEDLQIDQSYDTQYPPLNEFEISREEEKYWRQCQGRNERNIGKSRVLLPTSMDYFAESIMKAWRNRRSDSKV